MTFACLESDISRIIKSFSVDGYNYTIIYLDGSISQYICYNENEKIRLTKIMLEQAIYRQENINEEHLIKIMQTGYANALLSMILGGIYLVNINTIGTIVFMLISLIELRVSIGSHSKLNELKKYKLFLEMAKNLDSINQSRILKCIEFENIYQIPLDITTIDEYSYSDIKRIYKEYKLLEK